MGTWKRFLSDHCDEPSPPVGTVLQAESEWFMPPANKHHTCVTWGPECLQRWGDRVGEIRRVRSHVYIHWSLHRPVLGRYFPAHPPTRRRCHPRCPKHKAPGCSYQLIPHPTPHGRQTAPPAGSKNTRSQIRNRQMNRCSSVEDWNCIHFDCLPLQFNCLFLICNRRLWWLSLQGETNQISYHRYMWCRQIKQWTENWCFAFLVTSQTLISDMTVLFVQLPLRHV